MAAKYTVEFVEYFKKHYPNTQTEEFIARAKKELDPSHWGKAPLTVSSLHQLAYRKKVHKSAEVISENRSRIKKARTTSATSKKNKETSSMDIQDMQEVPEPPRLSYIVYDHVKIPEEVLAYLIHGVVEDALPMAELVRKLPEKFGVSCSYHSILQLFWCKLGVRLSNLRQLGVEEGLRRLQEYLRVQECQILYNEDWRPSSIAAKVEKDFPDLPPLTNGELRRAMRGYRVGSLKMNQGKLGFSKSGPPKNQESPTDSSLVTITLKGKLSYSSEISLPQAIHIVELIENS